MRRDRCVGFSQFGKLLEKVFSVFQKKITMTTWDEEILELLKAFFIRPHTLLIKMAHTNQDLSGIRLSLVIDQFLICK
jgi:hypothetical protein